MQFRLPGGDLEYAVLAKLWELGSATAREIHTQVGEPAGLVYTTTTKVRDRLQAKRLVTRERNLHSKRRMPPWRPRIRTRQATPERSRNEQV